MDVLLVESGPDVARIANGPRRCPPAGLGNRRASLIDRQLNELIGKLLQLEVPLCIRQSFRWRNGRFAGSLGSYHLAEGPVSSQPGFHADSRQRIAFRIDHVTSQRLRS